jgi:hypothetical protein
MGWRDKYKRRRRDRESPPAMVDFQGRIKNSVVQFSDTDRTGTVVRAGELDGTEVRQSIAKQGGSLEPPSGRSLFHLGPGAKRVVFDNVRFKGSGFDTFVSGEDAEHLVVTGCSMETAGAPAGDKPARYVFPRPSAPPVPSLEEQRRNGKLIGRNEPCPCLSGTKYKHCHGKLT